MSRKNNGKRGFIKKDINAILHDAEKHENIIAMLLKSVEINEWSFFNKREKKSWERV